MDLNISEQVDTKDLSLQEIVKQLSAQLQKEGASANLQQDCFNPDGSVLSSASYMITQIELFEHKGRTFLHLWNWDGADMLIPIQDAELTDLKVSHITKGKYTVYRLLSRNNCYLAVTLY